jgi:hypothetical protein
MGSAFGLACCLSGFCIETNPKGAVAPDASIRVAAGGRAVLRFHGKLVSG